MEGKKTPLYENHLKIGAKMVEFGGWMMPVEYSGIIDEHLTVRSKCGVFDLSHMGEIFISGKDASKFLQNLTTNNLKKLYDGKAIYSPMCKPDGGIVDDIVIYRFSESRYMAVVNAANIEKDYSWILENASDLGLGEVQIFNQSQEISLIAIQGKLSESTLQPLLSMDLSKVSYYHFIEGDIAGCEAIVSRTGYTGEDGFELYLKPKESKDVQNLWETLLEAAKKSGGKPIGLGARDTLRLEMKYALYGNDIDESTTPLEAALAWTVDFEKGDFIGRDALLQQKNSGIERKLVGFKMVDRGIARSHYPIYKYKEDEPIGTVTSGAPSPSLKENIGLGYVKTNFSKVGTEIEVEIRSRRAKAVVVKTPFWTLFIYTNQGKVDVSKRAKIRQKSRMG